jgi:hypothetical protein
MNLANYSETDSLALKARGIKRVLSNNEAWGKAALETIKALPVGWTGTGEDIRALVAEKPSHPNAWGGLINRALAADLIYPTGDYRPMKSKASHGRRTPVYERM